MVQVIACCLMAPSQYLNQRWLISSAKACCIHCHIHLRTISLEMLSRDISHWITYVAKLYLRIIACRKGYEPLPESMTTQITVNDIGTFRYRADSRFATLRSANEKQRYFVMMSLIGWAQALQYVSLGLNMFKIYCIIMDNFLYLYSIISEHNSSQMTRDFLLKEFNRCHRIRNDGGSVVTVLHLNRSG